MRNDIFIHRFCGQAYFYTGAHSLYVFFFLNSFCLGEVLLMIQFQEQYELNDYKPNDFQMAFEEHFLVHQGFTEKLIQDINIEVGNPTYEESVLKQGQKATSSSEDLDYLFIEMACFLLLITMSRQAPDLPSLSSKRFT